MEALRVEGLRKTYRSGTQALKGIDLSLKEGEFFALLGSNGAGKTTLISILAGLVVKSGGSAAIFGLDIEREPTRARHILGVVPQELNFNIFEKVESCLINHAGYYGIPRREARGRIEELLGELALEKLQGVEIRTLSGGMKRRLMLARALVHRPRLLLLDEPTTGVDVELRDATWRFLRRLNGEGMTILLTTHYLEEVEQLCRRVAFIKEGKVVRVDTVEQMIQSLERQAYLLHFETTKGLEEAFDGRVRIIDATTAEIVLRRDEPLSPTIVELDAKGFCVKDLHPKRNRLELLFLELSKR